jgi:uncharacterized membrane protein
VTGISGAWRENRLVRWAATARPPAASDPRSGHHDTGRLVAFSDGVFAITITLLVLEIKPPTDDANLLHGLAVLWPSYLAYALTFLFIGQVWVNHHVMFDHIRSADRLILLLNTLVLMVVAFLPFATSVLAGATRSGHGQRVAVGRRFELALAWLGIGALLGAALPVLGIAVIIAFNVFHWLPIRGESPEPRA